MAERSDMEKAVCYCGHGERGHVPPTTLGALLGFWGCVECIEDKNCQHWFAPPRLASSPAPRAEEETPR